MPRPRPWGPAGLSRRSTTSPPPPRGSARPSPGCSVADLLGPVRQGLGRRLGGRLIFGLLTPLLPLVIFFAGFFIIGIGALTLWRTVSSWIWFGMGRMRRY